MQVTDKSEFVGIHPKFNELVGTHPKFNFRVGMSDNVPIEGLFLVGSKILQSYL